MLVFWLCRAECSGSGSRMTTRRISFMRPSWFALKRDVCLPFVSPLPTPSDPHHFPALVKPSTGPRSWSKNVRRRTSMFASLNQIADPEPGSFQHKAHVGIDDRGNMVTEGEVDRKWSDFTSEPARPKVSSLALPQLSV